jgi:hypothetical protein
MKKVYFSVSVVLLAVSMMVSCFLRDMTPLIYIGFVIVFASISASILREVRRDWR